MVGRFGRKFREPSFKFCYTKKFARRLIWK